jgi:hypothetical protein
MGKVISFPAHSPQEAKAVASNFTSATVIILPVIRIERFGNEPSDEGRSASSRSRRRRRRRASRT